MKKTGFVVTILLLLSGLLPCTDALATTDGFYNLTEVTASWEGTDASRTKAPTADYDYTYGDESSVTYTLPWSFSFYGQSYTQINADTNGNVWFTTTGSAHSFDLAATNRGPVIAAWNDDLSSYYYGGVFIQHKTNPERVVIEWQAETYTEEGYYRLNDFETILFQDGRVRIDYKSFATSTLKDFGSGISENSGSNYISITSNYGNVYALAGRSFSFADAQLPNSSLSVAFSGTGGGTITTTPAGIACNASCTGQFPPWTLITLHPEAAQYSAFTGWNNGVCSGTGDCVFTISDNASVTAAFNLLPPTTDFTGTPTSGYVPPSLQVNFTSLAPTATSWYWDFGDGTFSTQQNPIHTYGTLGSYTVTHTATNSSGSTTISKTNYIVLLQCPNSVRNVRLGKVYTSLGAAYSEALSGDTLQLADTTFTEGINSSINLLLDGSYTCDFSAKTGRWSVLKGAQSNITGGTLSIKDIFLDK